VRALAIALAAYLAYLVVRRNPHIVLVAATLVAIPFVALGVGAAATWADCAASFTGGAARRLLRATWPRRRLGSRAGAERAAGAVDPAARDGKES
jgi:hypothetical protein